MAEEQKITPLQLRERYSLNIADLAWRTKVDPSVVYFMVMGYPIARQQAERILQMISTLTGQTYTLDTVQVALLSEEQEQTHQTEEEEAGKENLNIVILAWGSLLWEQGCLALASEWDLNGPEVPLEFSRVSTSRSGALTLVIDAIHGILFPTYVALSAFQTLDEARENLGEREGGGPGCVGSVNCHTSAWYSKHPPSIIARIANWGREYGFGAVIWTDLPSNFETIDTTQFSEIDEPLATFTVEHAKRYLHGLRPPGDALARAYINKAPAHIETPLRQSLASDPWLAVALQEDGHTPGATDGSPV